MKGQAHKITVSGEFLQALALMPLTPCEYKCILLVLKLGECTQAELSQHLEIARPHINRAVTRLMQYELLTKTKTEGRNIFFAVNTSFKYDEFDKDQLKIPT
jgi:predicted transcriptional regulator